MRFKTGRLVEVLTKKKVSSGVWRCAEIVSDNGDGYMVRYYRCAGIFKEGVDRVSAEAVRPCPPLPSSNSVVWAVGDVVEVLDGGFWKVSVIEEDFGDDCYQIRVIGSLNEFKVNKSNIRVRHEWKDNKWVSLGKDSENFEDLMLKIRKKARMQQQGNFNNVKPIAKSPSKSLKRSFSDICDEGSTDDDSSECMQKRRAKLAAIYDDAYSFIGKADSHGKDDLLSFTMDGRSNQSTPDGTMVFARASQSNDCLSVVASVASCSIIDPLPNRVLSHASTSCSEDDDSLCGRCRVI